MPGWHLPGDVKMFVERIKPRDVTVFHGNINPEKLNFMEKFAVKYVVKKPFGDYRDWKMITSWAAGVATELTGSIRNNLKPKPIFGIGKTDLP